MGEDFVKETEEVAYEEFYREIGRIEEEREEIFRELRELERDQEQFDDVQREVREIFREVWKHCEEESFVLEIEALDDELFNSYRNNENRMEERREQLEERKRKTYEREEEVGNMLRHRLNCDKE